MSRADGTSIKISLVKTLLKQGFTKQYRAYGSSKSDAFVRFNIPGYRGCEASSFILPPLVKDRDKPAKSFVAGNYLLRQAYATSFNGLNPPKG